MPNPIKEGIHVKLAGGAVIRVFPEIVVGNYAVHRRLLDGKPAATGVTVTHVPTGLAVWTVSNDVEAVRIAMLLDGRELVDDAGELRGCGKVELINLLSAVAKRFVPQDGA